MSRPKAEDIGSFDVTPSWERPQPMDPEPIRLELGTLCQCGLCQLAAAGHL